jgi:hypothetical protein
MIVSVNSGEVLDVPNFSTSPGTLIQQYPANGGTNQQWRFSLAPGSTGYEIVSVDMEHLSGGTFGSSVSLVLHVPNLSITPGTLIEQWSECAGSA